MYLSIEKEEARTRITERISGIRARTHDDQIEIRLNSGLLLAVLTDCEVDSGVLGTKLRYRMSPRYPPLVHGLFTAKRIKRLLQQYETRPDH